MDMRRWKWQDDASCRGESLVLFFGPDGERQPDKSVRERKAKSVCAGCSVRTECLIYAMSRPEKYGTWAGLNEDERASERRRRMRRHIPLAQPPAVSDFKQCRCCRATKSVEEFGPKPKNPDGLSNWCRRCTEKARQPTWARSEAQALDAS